MNYVVITELLITDGMDYRINSTTDSVAAGEMSKSFTINIINDDITECNETFNLTLSFITCGVVSGKTDTTEVTIKDKSRSSVGYYRRSG